jgi:putative transposase
MGRSRYQIADQGYPYFLTCTVVDWLPVFARPSAVDVVLDSFRFLQRERAVKLYAYVVMENHLHFIGQSNRMKEWVSRFKSFTARQIIDRLHEEGAVGLLDQLARAKKAHKTDREYQFWQEGSHPECISNEAIMKQKVGYIHWNPVRRGYVDAPEHWRYSSARNYAGLPGLIEVERLW